VKEKLLFFSITILVLIACQKEVSLNSDTSLDTLETLSILNISPDSARIGDTVFITGTGFSSEVEKDTVRVNNTIVQVFRATQDSLYITLPASTTSGRITVIVNGNRTTSTDAIFVVQEAPWVKKADFPLGWGTFVNGFSINEKGYFFSGNKLWAYDPPTNIWSEKTSLPSNDLHNYSFCFVIGSKAYVGLGAAFPGQNLEDTTGGKNYREVWEYNAALDKWTQKSNFPGSPRVAPFSFAVNGYGFMGGGDTTNANHGQTSDFWKYDPVTDGWKRLSDFPGQTSIGFSGFTIAGAGYVLEVGPGNPTAPIAANYTGKLWKYNVDANTWIQKANVPTSNFVSGVTFTINNKAYAALGVMLDPNNSPPKKDFWLYEPDFDKWTRRSDVGGGLRWLSSGFAIGSKGYIGLGTGIAYDDIKTDFWQYTPE
jgi:hypothetical protein